MKVFVEKGKLFTGIFRTYVAVRENILKTLGTLIGEYLIKSLPKFKFSCIRLSEKD